MNRYPLCSRFATPPTQCVLRARKAAYKPSWREIGPKLKVRTKLSNFPGFLQTNSPARPLTFVGTSLTAAHCCRSASPSPVGLLRRCAIELHSVGQRPTIEKLRSAEIVRNPAERHPVS